MTGEIKARWDQAYAGGDAGRSWTEARPLSSVQAIDAVALKLDVPIIDVGGGSSRLAAELLAAGYHDLTVLDVSQAALRLSQDRMGHDAERVTWIAEDLLEWEPDRRYAVWHDRAVLHFFTEEEDRRRYAALVTAAVQPGGHAVIAAFAPEGPERCSGLPVRRSSAVEMAELLAEHFTMLSASGEVHTTPSGVEQRFIRVTLRRDAP